jgi:ubiquinone biosynthesis protein COQ9
MDTPPADSLAALRLQLAPAVAEAAMFDGWSEAAVLAAAKRAGVDGEVAKLAFRDGAMAMIAAWIGTVDRAMAEALPPELLATLPFRERIRRLVEFRLDRVAPHEESLRRALAIMAAPRHAGQTLKIGWASADAMWRLAGDTSVDFNHYTKRAILAGVYAATLAVMVDDMSAGKAETRAFLARRIEGVMRFEKAKARFTGIGDRYFSPARFLGRLRYPAR